MSDLATATSAPVKPLDRSLRAANNSLTLEEHKRNRHWHRAASGVTQDTIRDQSYWALLARNLHRHDIVTVLADDESWEIELTVEKVLQDAAVVSVRKVYSRTPINDAGRVVDGIGNFFSEWRPNQGWCVVRAADGVAVIKGCALEATAIAEWQRAQPRKVA